jgi:heat shock protein 90kDa beta
VRRVFISDDADSLLPRYMSFLRGVVDSDSLPLNVNREMLQGDMSLRTISKKLVRKTLDLLKRLSDDEAACKAKQGKDSDKDKAPAACSEYTSFYKEFGSSLKLGILQDDGNRGRLAKLLRFESSNTDVEQPTTLDGYVSRMPPGQKAIYWLSGRTKEEIKRSPFVEKLLAEVCGACFEAQMIVVYLEATHSEGGSAGEVVMPA